MELQLSVEEGPRLATARNHTSTHLLHAALRKVLGDHVKQSGSLVGPDRLRFDFTHITAMTPEELEAVEHEVNKAVLADIGVETEVMAYDKAREKGAMALFGEKYAADVRVVNGARRLHRAVWRYAPALHRAGGLLHHPVRERRCSGRAAN